jgi:hypothetical protein
MKLVTFDYDYKLSLNYLEKLNLELCQEDSILQQKLTEECNSFLMEMKGDLTDPLSVFELISNKFSIRCILFEKRLSQINDYNFKTNQYQDDMIKYSKKEEQIKEFYNYAFKVYESFNYVFNDVNLYLPFSKKRELKKFELYSFELTRKMIKEYKNINNDTITLGYKYNNLLPHKIKKINERMICVSTQFSWLSKAFETNNVFFNKKISDIKDKLNEITERRKELDSLFQETEEYMKRRFYIPQNVYNLYLKPFFDFIKQQPNTKELLNNKHLFYNFIAAHSFSLKDRNNDFTTNEPKYLLSLTLSAIIKDYADKKDETTVFRFNFIKFLLKDDYYEKLIIELAKKIKNKALDEHINLFSTLKNFK